MIRTLSFLVLLTAPSIAQGEVEPARGSARDVDLLIDDLVDPATRAVAHAALLRHGERAVDELADVIRQDLLRRDASPRTAPGAEPTWSTGAARG